ncbi:MAG: ThuA domain-containing protein [Verrucomicrobia bacterium]|nr:ThuA domain-containing protein [Verrucomicrobiota bacterium]
MKTRVLVALVLSAIVAWPLRAAESGKLRFLVVTGGHGFEKEAFFRVVPGCVFGQAYKHNTEVSLTAATQGKSSEAYDRADLLTYDVVVLYDMVQTITDAQKAKFLALFDKGTGLVVTHHALGSYQDWPEYEKIIGGKYLLRDEREGGTLWPKSDYQHDVDIPVVILAKDHPITQGLKDFTIHDEIYKRFRVRPDVTPLLTTTHPESGKPLGWARTQGKSRVVYLELGHDHFAYENPHYQQLVARSIWWAAGR